MDAARRVRTAVEAGEGTTRGELAAELGLPLGTVTAAVAGLLRTGRLEERPDEVARSAARAGRPPTLLVAAGPPRTVGAVIWTHGRLQTAVATYGGRILARGEIEIEGDTSSPDVLEPAWAFLRAADQQRPLDRIVLGVPAPFQRGVGLPPGRLPVPGQAAAADAARTADPDPDPELESRSESEPASAGAAPGRHSGGFVSWLRPDPAAALARKLGVPVVIENDANLGALGESHAGAGRGLRCQIYLKLGERSVGAGLVLDSALYRGVSGFAGEIAHIHADDDGPLCTCGARGCLTARVRGPLLELMQYAYDRPLTYAEVLRLADADEPAPARVLRELGRTLGRPLADLCTFLNPGALILDGALGGAGRHVLAGLTEQIERYCAPAVAASLVLAPGELGADADILGAIRLARAEALAGD
jgi:predicted NBD/HSP70 family sugar kinase